MLGGCLRCWHPELYCREKVQHLPLYKHSCRRCTLVAERKYSKCFAVVSYTTLVHVFHSCAYIKQAPIKSQLFFSMC